MPEIISTDLNKLTAALGQLTGPGLKAVIQRSALQIGHNLVERLQKRPGPAHSPVIWASKKQRAWYFAMRAAAGLSPRYKRVSDPMSQKIAQSWGVTKYGDTGAIAGNRATYAPEVQSSEQQSAQHAATGWKTDADAVEELDRGGVMPKVVMANIDKYVRHVMRGL